MHLAAAAAMMWQSATRSIYLLVAPRPLWESSCRTVQPSVLTPLLAPAPAELQELFPNIIPQLGQENMAQMRNLHAQMQVGRRLLSFSA